MKKMILSVIVLFAAGSLAAQEASTAADQVPIEEYVPKVIIEGKWGTGPGEFGMASQFPLGHFEKYQPSSLAVDSKGNIYILDFVNDRIQKFNKSGKYMTELPVEGLKGELAGYCYDGTCYEEPPAPGQKIERKVMGQVEVQGINIVIDSKDTLYYYLKRSKDGKETGEVWQFRNDKLVKKSSFMSKGDLPSKFQMIPVSSNQYELAIVESPNTPKAQPYRVEVNKTKDSPSLVINHSSGTIFTVPILPSAAYSAAKAKYGRAKSDVYFEKVLENGNFRVRTVNGGLDVIETEEREYTMTGKLVRRIKSPPGYSHGIRTGESGIKVVRWVIKGEE